MSVRAVLATSAVGLACLIVAGLIVRPWPALAPVLFVADSMWQVTGSDVISGLVFFGWPVAFAILYYWCVLPSVQGTAVVQLRSVILALVALGLSAAWFASWWKYGVKYQGQGFVIGMAVLNCVVLGMLGGLLIFVRRTKSWRASMLFHLALFTWITLVAFSLARRDALIRFGRGRATRIRSEASPP